MRISYPWSFYSKNYNIKLKLYKKQNISDLFDYKEYCHGIDVLTDELLITFSDVVSSINEKDNIIYHENIIKCKINFMGKEYYFPIMTYVDHEYSLLRGYYLGFEKRFAQIILTDNRIDISNRDFDLDLCIELGNKINKNSIIGLPFLLKRNWMFDRESIKDEFVSLNVSEYTVLSCMALKVKDESFKALLSTLSINERDVADVSNYYFEDKFFLKGVELIV